MYILDEKKYDSVKPMFQEIPGCLWNIAVMENRKFGSIYVDNLQNPKSASIENPYLLYYFGGNFDRVFLDNV